MGGWCRRLRPRTYRDRSRVSRIYMRKLHAQGYVHGYERRVIKVSTLFMLTSFLLPFARSLPYNSRAFAEILLISLAFLYFSLYFPPPSFFSFVYFLCTHVALFIPSYTYRILCCSARRTIYSFHRTKSNAHVDIS